MRRKLVELRPEEELVARSLEAIFEGASVVQYDDGSEDGMFDLLLIGPVDAAIEVGLVTDAALRQARAHWRRNLERHQTTDLRWSWLFNFSEQFHPGAVRRFPWIDRPDEHALTAVLQRLEDRGVQRIGRAFDYAEVEPGGWRIGDPDVAELFALPGASAEHAQAIDLSHYGEPGGWEFAIAHGLSSHADPERLVRKIETVLHAEPLRDMRAKLRASGRAVRIGALVLDSSTPDGWATSHMEGDVRPSVAIELPAEITHAVVVGMNNLVLLYSEEAGWSRHDPAG